MKTFTLTIKNKAGQVISLKTIKASNRQEAQLQADALKNNFIPLTKAQKQMSEGGVNVTIG